MTVALVDLNGLVPLDEIERRHILRVMDAVQGNKTQAASILGLDRKTLYRKLDEYARARGDAAAALTPVPGDPE